MLFRSSSDYRGGRIHQASLHQPGIRIAGRCCALRTLLVCFERDLLGICDCKLSWLLRRTWEMQVFQGDPCLGSVLSRALYDL